MIKETKKTIQQILTDLADEDIMLDIGGASAPFKRANYIIDIVKYDDIYWAQAKGPGEIKFTKDTFVSHDICSREPWPFKDKFFDFSTCSHVLEDVRDPIWVCSEIIRVSKSGYIEIPSRLYETTFGLEMKNLAGASHHRRLVDLDDKRSLRFTFKYMHVHSKVLNKNKRHLEKNNPELLLRLEWSDNFSFYENWLGGGKENFEFLLNKKLTDKDVWGIYRRIGPRNFIVEWLSYFKNTNSLAKKIFIIIKTIWSRK